MHKDLELYVFKKGSLGKLSKNPHDIVFLGNDGKLRRANYQKEAPKDYELAVEILNGSYYCCTPPTEKDTVWITTQRGNRFLALSPEYMIASKLFSANGLRDCDVNDAVALLKRFAIDKDYLWSLAKNSEFSRVLKEDDLEDLASDIKDKFFQSKVGWKVNEMYGEAVPEVRCLPYSEKISVLRYTPEELALSKEKLDFIISVSNPGEPRSCVKGYQDPHVVRAVQRLCLRYALSEFSADEHKNWDVDTCEIEDKAADNPHFAVALTSSFKETMSLLGVEVKDPAEKDRIGYRILNRALATDYVHVYFAALQERIQKNDNPIAYNALAKGI
jgi:hypothetical protein